DEYLSGTLNSYVPTSDPDVIYSTFHVEDKRINYCADFLDKLEIQTGNAGAGASDYELNNKMDYLLYTFMTRTFPAISVKKSYRKNVQIRWCHNCGHNSLESVELYFDKTKIQTITNITLDIQSQFFIP